MPGVKGSAALVGASVLALAACGGGSATLTKAQYDAKVDRLCLLSADAFREMHLTNTVDAYRRYAPNILRADHHFLNTLGALKPPSSIANAAIAYRNANAKVLHDDEAAIAAARAGDARKLYRAIAKASRDSLAAGGTAKAIGATGCYIR